MKLTDTDKDVLQNGATGRSEKWELRWHLHGKNVTRSVNKLRKAGMIDITHFNGHSYAHPNPDAAA